METNFVCPACGGVVVEARREIHAELWCPGLAAHRHGATEEKAADDEADEPGQSRPVEVKALLSPLYEAQVSVELSFLPGVPLRFTQWPPEHGGSTTRLPEHLTGGQLWWTETVLAEYLVAAGWLPERRKSGAGHCRAAVALGCGVAPVSALVAAALGWEVLCTDLPEVLTLARSNAVANSAALLAVRAALVQSNGGNGNPAAAAKPETPAEALAFGRVVPRFLPLPFGEEIRGETRMWIEEAGNIGLVLCSDCIWQAHRHRPLAVTLAQLLRAPGSEALVAYQLRQGDELAFFSVAGHYGLVSERLDVSEAVKRVRFPRQLSCQGDPISSFAVHRVWRQGVPGAGPRQECLSALER